MKLNALGLASVCSLLSFALLQSVEAGSVRVDNGSFNGWIDSDESASASYTNSPYALSPGLSSTLLPDTFTANTEVVSDVSSQDGYTGLLIQSASMYNWYTTGNLGSQTIQDQIIVYTLADNTGNSGMLFDPHTIAALSSNSTLSGDVEIQFNYNDAANASFTFGGYTYSSPTGGTPDADFLFSASGVFLGSLTADGSTGVNYSSSELGGWSNSPAGGTLAAPEIDSSSTIAALTLLIGMLAVMKGGRGFARNAIG